MIKVRLGPPRSNFTGKLGGVNWKDGCATLPTISNRMKRSYGVVEDKSSDIDKPSSTDKLTVTIEAPALKEIVDEAIENVKVEINTLDPEGFNEILKDKSDEITEIVKEVAPQAMLSDEEVESLSENVEVNQKAADEGAKELADIVAAKKQEIEANAVNETNETSSDVPKNPLTGDTLKKSEVKSLDDFKGVGSWGKYKSYVKEVTGISPRNKKECAEALSNFIATLED